MCSSVMSLCCPMFVYCEPNLLRRRLSDLLKESYRSKVAFCIPILVDSSIAYDVSKRQTPEMVEQATRMPLATCDVYFFGRQLRNCRFQVFWTGARSFLRVALFAFFAGEARWCTGHLVCISLHVTAPNDSIR